MEGISENSQLCYARVAVWYVHIRIFAGEDSQNNSCNIYGSGFNKRFIYVLQQVKKL
jgi:hypothetical protein